MNDTDPSATQPNTAVSGSSVVVWDLRTPTSPAELGSKVDRFVEADGPATMTVIFPSGREISGTFERGALGEADGAIPGAPIGQVVLLSVVDGPDDLAAEIAAFTDEFGPVEADIARFVEEYQTAFDRNGAVEPDDFGGVGAGRSARSFDAEPQDGITPSLSVRVSGGVSLRWSLRFDPNGTAAER